MVLAGILWLEKDGSAVSQNPLPHHENVRAQLWRPSTSYSTDGRFGSPFKLAAAFASGSIPFARINCYVDIRRNVRSAYRVTALYFLHRPKPIFELCWILSRVLLSCGPRWSEQLPLERPLSLNLYRPSRLSRISHFPERRTLSPVGNPRQHFRARRCCFYYTIGRAPMSGARGAINKHIELGHHPFS